MTKPTDDDCLSLIQEAMENGSAILIEDIIDHSDEFRVSSFVDLLSHPFGWCDYVSTKILAFNVVCEILNPTILSTDCAW